MTHSGWILIYNMALMAAVPMLPRHARLHRFQTPLPPPTNHTTLFPAAWRALESLDIEFWDQIRQIHPHRRGIDPNANRPQTTGTGSCSS
jgi:hypothetical protein